jgi:hypothetical protein
MANFTVRIQLKGDPDQDVYGDLHDRMEKEGFLRTVSGVDESGKQSVCNLPHGTYYGQSNVSCATVRDWAAKQATDAWGKNVTFVAQTETWGWA